MGATSNIALSFLAIRTPDFTYTVFRKKLEKNQGSVPGTRYLPENCSAKRSEPGERERYEVSLQPKDGLEEIRLSAWINQGLTDDVLHQALISRTRQPDLVDDTELPDRSFIRDVSFVLARHPH